MTRRFPLSTKHGPHRKVCRNMEDWQELPEEAEQASRDKLDDAIRQRNRKFTFFAVLVNQMKRGRDEQSEIALTVALLIVGAVAYWHYDQERRIADAALRVEKAEEIWPGGSRSLRRSSLAAPRRRGLYARTEHGGGPEEDRPRAAKEGNPANEDRSRYDSSEPGREPVVAAKGGESDGHLRRLCFLVIFSFVTGCRLTRI